jgi:hypothetical protein
MKKSRIDLFREISPKRVTAEPLLHIKRSYWSIENTAPYSIKNQVTCSGHPTCGTANCHYRYNNR